jgi:Protein of unknown function (DUF3179)
VRYLVPLFLLAPLTLADDPKPILIAKPDAFATLVNPNCSHCVDEAKRRKDELKDSDPVLCWTRGYSDGGAIPLRFFLNTYRVISDSYGVFVYDPDAGYARGFAPSYNFVFHGWRNGVMVMRDKTDDTLYSCLSGVAFDGPRKGDRLKPVPTIVTTWGEVMKRNPNAVAYHMFEKYKPSELPTKANEESAKSRLAWVDPKLKADEMVLGVRMGDKTQAYLLRKPEPDIDVVEVEELNNAKVVVIHNGLATAAYKPIASQPRNWKGPNPDKNGVSPPDSGTLLPGDKELPPKSVKLVVKDGAIIDEATGTKWDITGRGYEGPLKGWTLDPVDDSVVCKYFAYVADYREAFKANPERQRGGEEKVDPNKKVRQVAGSAEFLRLLPKPFGAIKAIDPKARTVSLLLDGEKTAKVWSVEPDAEIKVNGFWGRLDQFKVNDRVWVWLKLDRTKNPISVAMMADELSEQYIHDQPWKVGLMESTKWPEMERRGKELPTIETRFIAHRDKLEKTIGDLDFCTMSQPKVVFLHTEGGKEKWITIDDLEKRRAAQQLYLRKRWTEFGLPGVIAFHHPFSGEMDVTLDHEAMRWGRSLKYGDSVELTADPPIKGVVKSVTPWRERTQVRLVVGELQSSELKSGQRIGLKMPAPPKEVDDSPYPPDIGRRRTDDERVEWFLCSIYCVCGVGNDICTGHFYTLASCNPNGCGAPNATRDEIRDLIAKGKSDKEIWDSLLKDRGPLMLRPHLKP